MDAEPEAIRKVKATLSSYSKSREEVAYIRRVLALHLQQQCQTDSLPVPLSLLSLTDNIPQRSRDGSQNGIFDKYLKAAAENVKAHQKYSEARQGPMAGPSHSKYSKGETNPLEEHLAQVKLRRKQDKLRVLEKYFDRLSDQTAASETSDLGVIFQDGRTLPDVPKEVMNSFSETASTGKSDLSQVLDQMERVVLRTKLLLRREEQLLEDVRERAEHATRNITDEARLHALNETRNELINWIESELGKAAGTDGDEANGADSQRLGHGSDTDIGQHLSDIKEKYGQYLDMRKSLLTLVSETWRPALQPNLPPPSPAQITLEETPAPSTHLLIPYLEKLLEISRKQKGMIQHKSHLTATLSKQAKETRQMLNYLTEESQLLPSHPMPGSKAKGNFGEEMAAAASDKADTTRQVKPWVYAADSAKIATFEAVAEKVEEGQLALEDSMKALFEIDLLLGRQARRDADEGASRADDDIWLAEGAGTAGSGTQAQTRKPKQTQPNDPWSALHGNLGLIGEDSPRR